MKTATIIGILLLATSVMAKPMPVSVTSWEGDFILNSTNIPIKIDGLPRLLLWRYNLHGGARGTAIGFSIDSGDMIWAPTPQEKGTQPIYAGHVVVVNEDTSADIIITYKVQGNGGWQAIEKYHYNGRSIALESTTMNGGKPDFMWFRQDEGANHAVEGTAHP